MGKKDSARKRILLTLVIVIMGILAYVCLAMNLIIGLVARSLSEMYESSSVAIRSANEMIDDERKLIDAYEEDGQCKKDAIAWLKKKGVTDEAALKERYELADTEEDVRSAVLADNADKQRIAGSVAVGSTGFLMFIDTKEQILIGYPDAEMNGSRAVVATSVRMPVSDSASVMTDYFMFGESLKDLKLVAGFRAGGGLKVVGDSQDIETYIATDIGSSFIHALIMAWNLWLIFLAIVFIAVRYAQYSLREKQKEYGQFRQWLVSMLPIGCILVFAISFFLYTLHATANQFNYENLHSKRMRTTIENYKERTESLEEWYSHENLIKCRMAADMVAALGSDPDREELREISEILKVRYTYRYDSNGKVIVTDAPYDNIVLSGDEESFSYAFRPLLKGVESVVQEIVQDEFSGDPVQYIGVSLRDNKDKADGFVQICVPADTLDTLTENYSMEDEIGRVGSGSDEIAFFVDGESKEILYSSREDLAGKNLEDSGISNITLKDGVNGTIQYEYRAYLSDVSEMSGGFLVLATPAGTSMKGRIYASVFQLVATAVTLLLVIFISLFRYKELQEAERKRAEASGSREKEAEASSIPEDPDKQREEAERNEWGLFISVSDILKDKSGKNREAFERRWNENGKSGDELSSEEKIGRTIGNLIFLLSAYVVFVLLFDGLTGRVRDLREGSLEITEYLLYGNWDKGFNIFAVTMCILIICIAITAIGIFNRLIYRIARVSNTRIETICMFLRSSTKYIAGILIVYLCVGQFVEDATTLFATTGVISVVIGLGAKDLIGDILAGFFLVFEDAFRVGDLLSVDGWIGEVSSVGIRMTTVTSYGDIRLINNSDLKNIINMNSGTARVMVKVAIAYKEDLEKVEELLKRELPMWKDRLHGAVRAPYYGGVDRMEYNAVYLCVGCYCESFRRWSVQRALNRELKLLFDQNQIKTSYELVPFDLRRPMEH